MLDSAPPQASPPDSGAQPRSQSNWAVGIVVAAILGAILVGLVATVFLVDSINIPNPFEDSGAVEPAATETTLATATTFAPGGNDYYGLLVGDCINDDELVSYIAGNDYETTPCDGPHDSEAYLVHEFPPGSYPGGGCRERRPDLGL